MLPSAHQIHTRQHRHRTHHQNGLLQREIDGRKEKRHNLDIVAEISHFFKDLPSHPNLLLVGRSSRERSLILPPILLSKRGGGNFFFNVLGGSVGHGGVGGALLFLPEQKNKRTNRSGSLGQICL